MFVRELGMQLVAEALRGWNLCLVAVMLAVLPSGALAQCQNAATPSCGVYKSCFAKQCPCSGADEYFVTYGEKYCKAFLGNASLSSEGQKWRDRTLICLQEAIVPKLDLSNEPKCNCQEMRKFAFDTHVSCYTQPGASICNLPIGDVTAIASTVNVADMMDAAGWRQMRDVASICETSAPDASRQAAWKAMALVLKLRSP